MATYYFKCDVCGTPADLECPMSEISSQSPACPKCGAAMVRDWVGQGAPGFPNPSKGRYGFISENILPEGVPVHVDSAQTEARLLKATGKERHTVSAESQYRYKHRLDYLRAPKGDGR